MKTPPIPSQPPQVSRRAGLRVTQRLLKFTQRQDLELTAGVDLDWPTHARGSGRTAGGGGTSSGKVKAVSVGIRSMCTRARVVCG